jgi:hypothetical protein
MELAVTEMRTARTERYPPSNQVRAPTEENEARHPGCIVDASTGADEDPAPADTGEGGSRDHSRRDSDPLPLTVLAVTSASVGA